VTENKIKELIFFERKRQNKLHPNFGKTDSEKLMILVEEVGEVAKAIQEGDVDNLKEELVQVAAVAQRWLEGMEE